jgi:hypothetical protein
MRGRRKSDPPVQKGRFTALGDYRQLPINDTLCIDAFKLKSFFPFYLQLV